jgi:UDP-N-acetylmuramate: L-alanyl-gamma-D-glutamyl-meso-diaminopimelate ligase
MEKDQYNKEREFIYRQNSDNQRIVITGGQSALISGLVFHVLKYYKRAYDYVTDYQGPIIAQYIPNRHSNILLVQGDEEPSPGLSFYQHHVIVLGDIRSTDEAATRLLADATPKGGIILYSETEPARSIGKAERADASSLGFNTHPHVTESGMVWIITDEKEKLAVPFTDDAQLRALTAARELLKKIGVTSGQFYVALSGFKA